MTEEEKAEWMAKNNAIFSHLIGEKEVWESPKFTLIWHNGLESMGKKEDLTKEESKKIFN